MNSPSPQETIERFSQLLSESDLDAVLDLYEPDAVFAPRPGEQVRGHDAIREALVPFAAIKPRMTGKVEKVLRAGELALVANRWTLAGSGPEGPIEMAGVSADVLRRRADGSWGIVIDDPWGAEG
jgi:uncharacterized protein (TIGR02246 family)